MNLIDFVVLEVIEDPKRYTCEIEGREIEYWKVKCITLDMSERPQEEELIFSSYEEAKEVKKGYKGLH